MNFLSDLQHAGAALDTEDAARFAALLDTYRPHAEHISSGVYERLSTDERARFVLWFLKRWGKIDRIEPTERERYNVVVQRSFAEHGRERIGDGEYVLRRYADAGHDFALLGYDWFTGVHDIHFDQYAAPGFDVRPGDVIIDGGAFIGDTAVLFHAKTGGDCQIHAFELLDENLVLLQRNLDLNGIAGNVVANKYALGDRSGVELSIALTRLQASMSLMYAGEIKVSMIKLDDYVRERGLSRVDFIKLDIEGAEIPALEGARETIERFRPRMALCLYHKWDDVLTIPAFLDSLNVDYDYRFKWVQLKLGTEAVILLTPKTADIPVSAR
ncbi:FkbM family methyltransferase [Xanthomonas sp. NCPPB 2654]|uniref:FkbM family methyltransferase n=1 Tax=unclassified Xanthomonas TaxID=2643310 RepID=UPI0021DFEEFF|nr:MULTISPECIES: FkbM family methyltransferase [unclassified Xanthomonas]MDL5367385.1 FkbM family methyltransferase [Xanthomonas sp. NCPPB 2654]MEB1529629.1 FkbM family methyltransferase [Xanthomonas campestris pv. campestris]UYC19286.1 FkbM family methyltransferase [Xanthomonas sp. CFBP 8443]